TAPDTTIDGTPADPSGAGATFAFSASEPGATLECALDTAAFAPCTSPVSPGGLVDGAHTVRVRATDAAGNTDASPASFTWTVDATAPDTSITSGPSGVTSAPTASFDFDAGEAGASYECRLDAGAWAACTSPQAYGSLSDGSHDFDVRATDALGNVEPTPASRTWTVDATAPDTSITSGPSGPAASASASFAVSSPEAGVSFECARDGAAFTACTSTPSYTALADGPHTLQVRAVDAAGNTDATPASRSWTVDTIVPNTTIASGPAGTVTTRSASFGVTASEAGVSFQCARDGAAFSACTSTPSYTALADGAHTLQVRAVDAAGNTDATPASRTWTVDATPPVTAFYRGPDATWPSTSATFASADSEDVVSRMCKLDAGAWAACNGQTTLTGLSQGTHTYSMRAGDAAGNAVVSPATWTFTVSGTAAQPTQGPVSALGAIQSAIDLTIRRLGANGLLANDGAVVTFPSPGAGHLAVALVAPNGTPPTAVIRGSIDAPAGGPTATMRLRVSAVGRTLLQGLKGTVTWSVQVGQEGPPLLGGVWPQSVPAIGDPSAT
ncbi:MAG: large repetitive protein, partial [Baekduia sp.]|nr:large repetitive protein [Baekduia sp.]